MASLLLGAGNCRLKKLRFPTPDWSGPLTTIDMNPNCGADVVRSLEERPLPFDDEQFDELGAYDVLEHIGKQGDWRGFFDEFAEYHRILKPGGTFGIIVPIGNDYHADPGHTRFFSASWFLFLDQDKYAERLAEGVPVTDYRWYWKKQFDTLLMENIEGHHLAVVLRKPL